MRALTLTALVLVASAPASAAEPGDEVELSSAPVTALPCARRAVATGKLENVTSCPLEETREGLVVFDVAERTFYRLDRKGVRISDLERAFGGGAIDLTGKVTRVDPKDQVPTLAVTELRVTPKPKAGSFKGCL